MSFNFSNLFKAAHKLARATRAYFATYREAFATALKAAWNDLRGFSIVGKTRQWAFDKYNELKAARNAAREARRANRCAATDKALEDAWNAVTRFSDELCNHCGVNGRAIRNLEFWFRTSLKGILCDADDVIEAC